jgi:hypothetical protein
MPQEQLSPQQSLTLIQDMIGKTRDSISGNAIYFLVWGWLTFVACTAQFILKHFLDFKYHYLAWAVVFIGIVFSLVQGNRDSRQKRVKTYVDESMNYLWLGMAISFFVLSVILTKLGWGQPVFPFFTLLYGLGAFVSGHMIRFRPLIIGGEVAWGLAIGSTFVSYDFQMLFGAAAILVSYIIPAHLLRRKQDNANQ